MRIFLLVFSLVICSPAHGTEALPSSPRKVVVDFYAAKATLPAVTNLKQAEPFAVFFSHGLYRLKKSALEADEAYLKKNPTDKGYFGDGVSCIDNPEGYTSYSIKKVLHLAPNVAKMEVHFSYVDKRNPKEWSSIWTNMLLFTLENKRWMIDDIEYRDGDRIPSDLKKVIEDSKE
jgi:hypothetical protein